MHRAPSKSLALIVAALVPAACQIITEDMPSRASQIPAPSSSQPAALPTPASTPNPVPAPAATPAPAPTPAPTPKATPAPDPGLIDGIRVAFFGIKCPKGKATPNNGWKQLPVGCRGYVTATPKDKDNKDVPAKFVGPDIEWELEYGDREVDVEAPTFENDFNKDLVGRVVGDFGLCATVKGVKGCLHGRVTP